MKQMSEVQPSTKMQDESRDEDGDEGSDESRDEDGDEGAIALIPAFVLYLVLLPGLPATTPSLVRLDNIISIISNQPVVSQPPSHPGYREVRLVTVFMNFCFTIWGNGLF